MRIINIEGLAEPRASWLGGMCNTKSKKQNYDEIKISICISGLNSLFLVKCLSALIFEVNP